MLNQVGNNLATFIHFSETGANPPKIQGFNSKRIVERDCDLAKKMKYNFENFCFFTDFNDCANTTRCQNNGQCTDLINAYMCRCQGNITGVDCTEGMDRNIFNFVKMSLAFEIN